MNSALLSACVLLSFVALSEANSCSSLVNGICKRTTSSLNKEKDKELLSRCSAQYEGYPHLQTKIREFINDHILISYQYTLLATNFGNHLANRPGFECLYQRLSDRAWEDTIEIVKYNARRGGSLSDFSTVKEGTSSWKYLVAEQKNLANTEYTSMATAMDLQKRLASGANAIHKDSIRQGSSYHDPDINSFIENEFASKHANTIRLLSGHLSDINGILADYNDVSLSLYLFDEYLQKSCSARIA